MVREDLAIPIAVALIRAFPELASKLVDPPA